MRPTQDWTLVREIDQSKMHSDTIIFADPHGLAHQTLIGEVLAVGPGRKVGMKVIPCQSQVGDRVIFSRKRREISEPGEFWVRDRDILGVVG